MGLGCAHETASLGSVLGEGQLSRQALQAANINPDTGLATDYLNHFNEVVMLMEMLPDMPDCIEDVLDWSPADYAAHFEKSGFADKELAVLAYAAAPHAVRAHLETLIMQIDHEVVAAQEIVRADGSETACARVAEIATHEIKPLIAAASSAIHGEVEGETDYDEDNAQADIDALFD